MYYLEKASHCWFCLGGGKIQYGMLSCTQACKFWLIVLSFLYSLLYNGRLSNPCCKIKAMRMVKQKNGFKAFRIKLKKHWLHFGRHLKLSYKASLWASTSLWDSKHHLAVVGTTLRMMCVRIDGKMRLCDWSWLFLPWRIDWGRGLVGTLLSLCCYYK